MARTISITLSDLDEETLDFATDEYNKAKNMGSAGRGTKDLTQDEFFILKIGSVFDQYRRKMVAVELREVHSSLMTLPKVERDLMRAKMKEKNGQ